MGLPLAASRARVDLIHAPAYTAPVVAGVPVVVTIHDVSYARHPEWYPYRLGAARRLFYRCSARAAAHVVTDSAFSASEIAAAYGIPSARITVAPLGADDTFAPGPAGPLPDGVCGSYLLHVGDLHTRRNLTTVLDALLELRSRGAAPATASLSLVLAGVDRGIGDGLLARAAAAGMPGAVIRLGPVNEETLVSLYRQAVALVYPSLYEGFGLPLLEAMATGTPVVAAKAASIPEVTGDAALLVEPLDVEAWRAALEVVVSDPSRQLAMRTRGLLRASGFAWGRTARLTLGVYRAVLAR